MSFTIKAQENQQESKYISPGVNEVKITSIEANEPEGKSPSLRVKFETENGQTADTNLYFSDAARPYSETALGLIMTATGSTGDINGKTLTDVAKNLMKTVGNKMFRHRFSAEEIQGKLDTETGKQKNNWFKATFATMSKYSTESIDTNPSRLKPLDKGNKYDYKMLPKADVVSSNGVADSDSLPF